MKVVAFGMSIVASLVVEIISNGSVFASVGISTEGQVRADTLCFDSFGEMVFGGVSLILLAIDYSHNFYRVYWLLLIPGYMFQIFYGITLSLRFCR